MDLINQLATTLGVDADAARAVAGAVLGATRDQVPEAETAKLDEAVPELSDWTKAAESALKQDDGDGGGGLFGTLAKLAGSGAGNDLLGAVLGEEAQDTAQIVALFQQLGLKAEHASLAAPVVLDFLVDRVGKEWADRILDGAPILMRLVKSQLG